MKDSISSFIKWDAKRILVNLIVELPFWLRVPEGIFEIIYKDHKFKITVSDLFCQYYENEFTDSHATLIYFGPISKQVISEVPLEMKKRNTTIQMRKCRTVVSIETNCNEEALKAQKEPGAAKNHNYNYLRAFCEGHIQLINLFLNTYRLSTYDFFPHEITPWDVPFWAIISFDDPVYVNIVDYKAFDAKPKIGRMKIEGDKISFEDNGNDYNLISVNDLNSQIDIEPNPGELELLDALNLIVRGNYSDAVRRITTAIEIILEAVLKIELLKEFSESKVEARMKDFHYNFNKRLDDYQKYSKRIMSNKSISILKETRELRNSIVHRATRIPFDNRFKAEKAVDTGRWIYNWLENDSVRSARRERNIAKRSLGKHFSLFNTELTSNGVEVKKFPFA